MPKTCRDKFIVSVSVFCGKKHNFEMIILRLRIASMHPRNDIKNLQAAPTSGTSPKGGLKSFIFFYSKFTDYTQFYSAKLLLDTQKVIKKIINPLGSPKHPLRRGRRVKSVYFFVKFKVRRLQKKFFGRIASLHPRNDIKN